MDETINKLPYRFTVFHLFANLCWFFADALFLTNCNRFIEFLATSRGFGLLGDFRPELLLPLGTMFVVRLGIINDWFTDGLLGENRGGCKRNMRI